MIFAGVRSYPAYKGSGVAWLGKVPEQWEVVRTRYLFREIDQRSSDGSETHLSMSQKLGLVPTSMVEQRTLVSESYAGGKLCEEDDLVLNRLKAHLGVFALAQQNGVISPDYTVLRKTRPMMVKYFEHVLKSPACRSELRVRAKGIVEGFWRLYTDDLYDIRLPVPPVAEQAAIVRFLDHADQHIRRYIAAKKKLIALLNEQKQAIIDRAVTRGIDPSVALRPSGVEWLGDIPCAWGIEKIKALARPGYRTFVDGDWIESPYITDNGIRLVQTGNIGVGRYKEQGFRFISEATFSALGCTEFSPNDVLICRLGDPVGRSCLAPELGSRMITSVDVCILKTRQDVVPAFVVAAMSSRRYLEWVGSLVRGSTRDRVSRNMLGSFQVPVPPYDEQIAIVRHLDAATSELDLAIGAATDEIALLREYRSRLIADVVTGKLDVREAAAQLPDEEEAPEPSGRVKALAEDDEAAAEADLDDAEEAVG